MHTSHTTVASCAMIPSHGKQKDCGMPLRCRFECPPSVSQSTRNCMSLSRLAFSWVCQACVSSLRLRWTACRSPPPPLPRHQRVPPSPAPTLPHQCGFKEFLYFEGLRASCVGTLWIFDVEEVDIQFGIDMLLRPTSRSLQDRCEAAEFFGCLALWGLSTRGALGSINSFERWGVAALMLPLPALMLPRPRSHPRSQHPRPRPHPHPCSRPRPRIHTRSNKR